jgi:predicted metal-dependent enzyme (double-stranded beta helix superfamily)
MRTQLTSESPPPNSTEPFGLFIDAVHEFRARYANDVSALAQAVAGRLAILVAQPGWLKPEHRQPADAGFRRHLLYVAPDGGFSVQSIVWKPGQRTGPHDHVAWCVVGVYQGIEQETMYRLYQDEDGQFLVPGDRHVVRPGHAVALVPPDEDIHDVENIGDDLAVSIHVYGDDVTRHGGSSVNRWFHDVPTRAEPGGAVPARWRRLE